MHKHKHMLMWLVVIGLGIAAFFVWRQLSGERKSAELQAQAQSARKLVTQTPATIATKTPDEMKRDITSVHTRVFSRDNLLITKIDAQDQAAWQELLDGIKKFVEINNSDEMADFTVISKASLQLLITLDVVYPMIAQAFAAEKDKGKGLSSFDPKKIDLSKLRLGDVIEKLAVLAPYSQQLAQLQVSLANKIAEIKKSLFTKKIKREVCEVLQVLALGVELSINKVFGDLQFMLSKKLAEAQKNMFGQENLLLAKITKREERAWLDLVEEVRAFVALVDKKYAEDEAVVFVADASAQLITTVQELYKKMSQAIPLGAGKVQRREELNLNKVKATDITDRLRQYTQVYKGKLATLRALIEQKVQGDSSTTPRLERAARDSMLQLVRVVGDATQKLVDNTADLFPKFAFDVRRM